MHCALHLHPAITKICATRSRFCGVNDRFAVNFRGEFPCKIVPCPGAGHRGPTDRFHWIELCSKGGMRVTYIASCLVGCEVYKEASKAPSIVADSSSLVMEFSRN